MTLYAHSSERYSYIDIRRALSVGYRYLQWPSGKRYRLAALLPCFDEWYE